MVSPTVGPTDTNQVLLTGENNFMRLHLEENGPMTTRAGHWRILFSPAGPIPPAPPVITAVFDRAGDTSFFWTETVETEEESIELSWHDFGEPFTMTVPPGSTLERPLGWNSVFIPARRAQLTVNGDVAQGRPFPEQRGVRLSSTAGLALSETWVRPA